MCASLVATIGLLFLFFFATNIQTLLAAEILCGIPWGSEYPFQHCGSSSRSETLGLTVILVFQTLTTSYACEVAPVALRGYLTTWVIISGLRP